MKRDIRTRLMFVTSIVILCVGAVVVAGLLGIYVKSLRHQRALKEAAEEEAKRLAETELNLNSRIEELAGENSTLQTKLTQLGEQRDMLMLSLSETRQRITEQEEQLKVLTAEIEKLERDLRSAREASDSLKEQVEALKADLTRADEEGTKTRAKLATDASKARAALEETVAERDTAARKLADATKRIETLEAEAAAKRADEKWEEE